jgi:uncharacterized membrane protein YcjF (UPF0283 family)
MSINSFSRSSWQASTARSVVLIALPAIIGEAVQHLIEYKLGMYVDGDGIAPGQEARWRMIGAAIKVIGFVWTIARARSHIELRAWGETMPALGKMLSIAVLVAMHYKINYAAVGQPDWLVLTAVLVDCLVVGALASALGLMLPRRLARSRTN